MNLQQAKNIPITWFFDRVLGLRGTQSANDILYPSPFRTDNKPSYSVSIHKNISYDFATGEARDLVGSIAHHYGLSMSGALKKLEELLRIYPTAEYTSSFAQKPTLKAFDDKKRISPHLENQHAGGGLKIGDTEISEIKDLYYFPILNYIKSRKISVETASLYFKEIYFKMKGKKYFGLCYQNRNGGYEVAGCGSKTFKTAIGNKDITLIAGTENTNTVLIFEGMFDFLSYLEYEKLQKPQNDVIILNSVALWERGVEWVKSKPEYKKVHLYLDNDKAGIETTNRMKNYNITDVDIIDKSSLYNGFKDFGEWWESKLNF
jgi:hypothetical protein